jgi:hypothetical protein
MSADGTGQLCLALADHHRYGCHMSAQVANTQSRPPPVSVRLTIGAEHTNFSATSSTVRALAIAEITQPHAGFALADRRACFSHAY